uniref:Repat7 n=1 Tax=Spodoptera exigua TaxID=7107 RepID=C6G768_SPOEX|nr:repat7 [Spodoptera exigua]
MKSFMIIVVLSALAACYDAAVVPREQEMSEVIVFDEKSPNGMVLSRADFNARYGRISILLSESKDFVPAVEGQQQSVTKVYRAESDIKIGMTVVYTYLSHLPEIIHSPLGKNYVEITLIPRVGQGLNTQIQIYRRSYN